MPPRPGPRDGHDGASPYRTRESAISHAPPALTPRSPGAAGATPGLHVDRVTKRWRRSDRLVLDDVSLRVGPGELVRIFGDNGAGKTTLARIAAGLVLPDAGRVILDGVDHHARREFRRRLGFVAAGDRGLYARLTVLDQLTGWSRLCLLSGEPRRRAIAAAVDGFGLREILSSRVDRISMGQRQRVRLALAFLHDPAFVLLDEPATSLDEPGRALLARAVSRLLARGGLAIWISPEAELTMVPAAAEYRLSCGRLLA